jgi:hypothetical protein
VKLRFSARFCLRRVCSGVVPVVVAMILFFQVRQRIDARVGLDEDLGFLDVGGDAESHVLLAGGIVRGRAALDVHGAVLHQRNPVLRGHGLVLGLQLLAEGLL